MFHKKLKREIDSLGKSVVLTQAGILFLSDEVEGVTRKANKRADGILEIVGELAMSLVNLKKRIAALEEQKVAVKDESKKAAKVGVKVHKAVEKMLKKPVKRGRPAKAKK